MSTPLPWIFSPPAAAGSTGERVRVAAIIVPAVLGMLFCLLNAFGAELLCLSSGCALYADYRVAGIPVNLLGVAAFAAIVLVSLLARERPAWRFRLYLLLLLVVFLDTLFLAWQIAFWPCSSCLFVALLLIGCLFAALRVFPPFRSKLLFLVVLLWFAAFAPVSVAAGKELFLRPWSAFGPADAPVAVYFSPTCPSCKSVVLAILERSDLLDRVAFYPVAKTAEDVRRLALLLEVEGAAGLRRVFSDDPVPAQTPWSLRWRLLRNNMMMARMGVTTVPLVLAPQLIEAPAPPAALPMPGSSWLPANLLPAPQIEFGCSLAPGDAEPCD